MIRRHLAVAIAVVAASAVAATPAGAATKKPKKPKPYTKTVPFTDTTPDPTGDATSGTDCSSMMPEQYPVEDPISVTITYPGKLKIELDNKLDWALEVRDPKGNIIASSDGGDPNTVEGTTAKLKYKGKYTILPCNLTGEPSINVTYSYTPS